MREDGWCSSPEGATINGARNKREVMINIYSNGKRLTRLPVSMMAASFRVMPRVKYWEIIADNLSKAGWSWAASQRLISMRKQSSLLTHIAATENVSSLWRTKY